MTDLDKTINHISKKMNSENIKSSKNKEIINEINNKQKCSEVSPKTINHRNKNTSPSPSSFNNTPQIEKMTESPDHLGKNLNKIKINEQTKEQIIQEGKSRERIPTRSKNKQSDEMEDVKTTSDLDKKLKQQSTLNKPVTKTSKELPKQPTKENETFKHLAPAKQTSKKTSITEANIPQNINKYPSKNVKKSPPPKASTKNDISSESNYDQSNGDKSSQDSDTDADTHKGKIKRKQSSINSKIKEVSKNPIQINENLNQTQNLPKSARLREKILRDENLKKDLPAKSPSTDIKNKEKINNNANSIQTTNNNFRKINPSNNRQNQLNDTAKDLSNSDSNNSSIPVVNSKLVYKGKTNKMDDLNGDLGKSSKINTDKNEPKAEKFIRKTTRLNNNSLNSIKDSNSNSNIQNNNLNKKVHQSTSNN